MYTKNITIEEDEDDYVIHFYRYDGTLVKVRVPKSGTYPGDEIMDGEEYGLNMVFNGHYI